jgi:hypothetical protein
MGYLSIMPCMYSAVVEHGLPNGKRRKPPRIPPWGFSPSCYSAAVEREPPNAQSLPEPHGTSRSRTGIRQEGRRRRRSRARPACQGQRLLREGTGAGGRVLARFLTGGGGVGEGFCPRAFGAGAACYFWLDAVEPSSTCCTSTAYPTDC